MHCEYVLNQENTRGRCWQSPFIASYGCAHSYYNEYGSGQACEQPVIPGYFIYTITVPQQGTISPLFDSILCNTTCYLSGSSSQLPKVHMKTDTDMFPFQNQTMSPSLQPVASWHRNVSGNQSGGCSIHMQIVHLVCIESTLC